MQIRELQIGKPLSEFPGGTVNKLIRTVNQLQAQQQPRKRGGGRGGSIIDVAIVDSFSGATWDGTNKTNETITVYPYAADGSISESRSMEVEVTLGLDSARTITAGKFISGQVSDGKLIGAQCPEWTLPAGWGET